MLPGADLKTMLSRLMGVFGGPTSIKSYLAARQFNLERLHLQKPALGSLLSSASELGHACGLQVLRIKPEGCVCVFHIRCFALGY